MPVSVALPNPPAFLQAFTGDSAINYSAQDFRNVIGAIFPYSGRLGAADSLQVTQKSGGANWSVDVLPGYAVVGPFNQASMSSGGGGGFERYVVCLRTKQNIALTSAFNTSGTARTHRVYLTVDDKNVGGTTYGSRLIAVEDPGGGAAPPTDTAYYLELAQLSVVSGQSTITGANITNTQLRADFSTQAGFISIPVATITGTNARYTIAGNQVSLAGYVSMASGANFSSGSTVVGTMPLGARPSTGPRTMTSATAAGTSATSSARITVGTNGDITAVLTTGNNPATVYLDGVNYQLNW